MIGESTLTAKNQTTVPKAIVDALGLKPSTKLIFELTDQGQLLVHVKQGKLADLAGMFRHCGKRREKPVTLEEMDAAVRTASSAAYLKSIGETPASFQRKQRPAK
jgi:bifunctional DNA-binding transcriptional regulator/antitoxin component of YhaV-PrlF toxin-antitoxin module